MPLDYPDEFSGNGTVPCPDFGNINNSDATEFDINCRETTLPFAYN